LASEGDNIEQVDAELRRVADAADGLVRSAQELRGALDSLSESVRAAVREAATAASVPAAAPSEQAPEPAADPVAEDGPAEPAGGGEEPVREEPEGARIVALNMVLDGKSRDEVATHLRDEFDYPDSDKLLDDVYSRVG
jgi:hypothetical protein